MAIRPGRGFRGLTMPAATKAVASAALAVLLALSALAPGASAALDPRFDPSKLQIPPLRPIPKVTPARSVLPNGMVLYLLEEHELPLVAGTVYFRASTAWAPPEKVGLGELTATVMRSGGSAAKTGDWLDDRLGAIGASVGTSMSADLASGSFRSLTENASEVLELLAEVLQRPAFPENKLDLAKVSLRRQIASRNDEIGPLASRVASQAVFGKDSPWARVPEYATVEAITRGDAVNLHRVAFAPERAVMVVVGDFRSADMKKRITTLFGGWKKSGTAPPAMPPVMQAGSPRVVFAPKNDVTQSAVILAHLGFKADDPDLPEMDVLEQALGGGFQSRLFNRIRTQRGLAYSASASAGGGYFKPGVFQARTLTRNDSVMVSLDLMREEVTRVTREALSAEEATLARESVENSMVFFFERPSDVAFRLAFYEIAGYPADFLQKYQAELAKVTPESILEAAKRKVHPDRLVTVIVGKEAEFDRPVNSLGLPLERVDISIPPAPSKLKSAPATPAGRSQGRAMLQKAAEWAGGTAAFAGVKSWREESAATLHMGGQTAAIGTVASWRIPDRLVLVQKLPMGEMTQGYDGSAGWGKAMGEIRDQPDMGTTVKQEYERSLFHLFSKPDAIEVQAEPEKRKIEDVELSVAQVKSDVVRDWQLFFAMDGRLAGMSYVDHGPVGEATFVTLFDDWRDVGGVKYPFASRTKMNGEPFLETTVKEAKLNPELPEAMFRKPAE